MPETRHDCPGQCGRSVSHRMFACPDCWHRLPAHIRAAVTAAWHHRAEHRTDHRDAMREANTWYAINPVAARSTP
jgi:hypothetical protein